MKRFVRIEPEVLTAARYEGNHVWPLDDRHLKASGLNGEVEAVTITVTQSQYDEWVEHSRKMREDFNLKWYPTYPITPTDEVGEYQAFRWYSPTDHDYKVLYPGMWVIENELGELQVMAEAVFRQEYREVEAIDVTE